MDELRALVEEGGIVFVRFDYEKREPVWRAETGKSFGTPPIKKPGFARALQYPSAASQTRSFYRGFQR